MGAEAEADALCGAGYGERSAALNGSNRGATRGAFLRGGWHRRFQRLTHRTPMHPVLVGQRPDRQPLDPMIPADRRELFHL